MRTDGGIRQEWGNLGCRWGQPWPPTLWIRQVCGPQAPFLLCPADPPAPRPADRHPPALPGWLHTVQHLPSRPAPAALCCSDPEGSRGGPGAPGPVWRDALPHRRLDHGRHPELRPPRGQVWLLRPAPWASGKPPTSGQGDASHRTLPEARGLSSPLNPRSVGAVSSGGGAFQKPLHLRFEEKIQHWKIQEAFLTDPTTATLTPVPATFTEHGGQGPHCRASALILAGQK